MKTIVVFFSKSGRTKQAAEWIPDMVWNLSKSGSVLFESL